MKISVLSPSIRPKGLAITQSSLARQTFTEFEWLTEISIPDRGHDLNAAYNRMLKRAKGELIVSLQDYIRVGEDFLEKCWKAYSENPRTFFTCPVGKTLDWKTVEWDWRKNKVATMDWMRWEIDAGFAPLAALKEIGGFDETLDEFWSADNVNVGFRADLAGYKFANLIENDAVAYDHDKTMKHPFRDKFNPIHHNYRLDQFRMGLKIDYLK